MLKAPEGYDLDALEEERLAIRPDAESAMRSEIEEKTGVSIQEKLYADSLSDAERSLTVQEKQQSKEQTIKEMKQKKEDWFR